MLKKNSLLLFLPLLIFLFYGCATRGNPSGGPLDRTPPYITVTYPDSNATLVSGLKEISIEFSERMSEGTLANSLFISPPLQYDMNWSGSRKLKLILKDTLKSAQTYVVSIGTDAKDERGNKMRLSAQFAFSTGAKIDQAVISGKVHGLSGTESVSIFGYRLSGDSLVIFDKTKPDYISQTGENGSYKLNYLAAGTYRVLAVEDQNNNLLIDSDFEKIGIPYLDVALDSMNLSFKGLDFRLTKNDTINPFITGVRAVYNHHVQIRLSEPVVTPDLSEITVIDSLSSESLGLLGISQNIESTNILDLFTEPMDSSARYLLTAAAFTDSLGNKTVSDKYFPFVAVARNDTTQFLMVLMTPADSAKSVRPEDPVFIEFTTPVNWESVSKHFSLTKISGDTINGSWKINSQYDAEFVPETLLEPDSSYLAVLNSGRVSDLWGESLADSVQSHYFTIISSKELGEISGRVRTVGADGVPVHLQFDLLKGRNKGYSLKLKEAGDYMMKYLPEGKYLINAYLDADSSDAYSPGKLFPFEFSEPFIYNTDTVKVRKRWETGSINISIPNGTKY
ncbi:MAG: Ig-like domain-containing protein [Calditrichaceae bacterium]